MLFIVLILLKPSPNDYDQYIDLLCSSDELVNNKKCLQKLPLVLYSKKSRTSHFFPKSADAVLGLAASFRKNLSYVIGMKEFPFLIFLTLSGITRLYFLFFLSFCSNIILFLIILWVIPCLFHFFTPWNYSSLR